MSEHLSRRAESILEAIIDCFVTTGVPVASRTISRGYGLTVSPATVRNEMMDLEAQGYLTQPYTSAGRVPTVRAFRWFVEERVGRGTLERRDREHLNRLAGRGGDLTSHLRAASQMLSRLSGCPGMAVSPKIDDVVFHRAELVRLAPKQLLVLFVSAHGLILHRTIRLEDDVEPFDLERVARRLNASLTGAPLAEVRERVLADLDRDRETYGRLGPMLAELGAQLDEGGLLGEVYVEGTSRLLTHQEFADPERMRSLIQALEDRELIVQILDRARAEYRVTVVMGRELGIEGVDDVALVTAGYGLGSSRGTIGILGPTRLNYPRVVPMVEYAAKLLSRSVALS